MAGCGRKLGDFDCCTVVTGDFRELGDGLPGGSIDLIYGDPPYSEEYVGLYEDIAAMGSEVLKPDGLCMLMVANVWQDRIMELMGRHLKYVWMMALWLEGPDRLVYTRGRNVQDTWRAVLVYGKDESRSLGWVKDSGPLVGMRGDGGDWLFDPIAVEHWMERLTDPGAVVLDPVCGYGTFPVVAKRAGRHCLGFEIDPSRAEVAERALESARRSDLRFNV